MSQRRFTLIELLMVILIIAILISLLVPVAGRGYHLAKHAKCLNTQKQYYSILVLYSQNNKSSTPVFASDWTGGTANFAWDIHKDFFTSLLPYSGTTDSFHCAYNAKEGHAFNNPSNTCEVRRAPSLLHNGNCAGIIFWGDSLALSDPQNDRNNNGRAHNSPSIASSRFYAYDQSRSFSKIKPAQPLLSDRYYYYNNRINRSYLHTYNEYSLFAQVKGDGSGHTAREDQLFLLNAKQPSGGYGALYGIP
jgi:type II secretory pathway pseudopilin PulG